MQVKQLHALKAWLLKRSGGVGRIRERDPTFLLVVNRCHAKLCKAESFSLLHLDFSVFCHGWVATGPLHHGFVLKCHLTGEKKKKIKKKGKKRESLKKKGKSFCKNVVIPAPDSRVEAAGTPGDLTSALPYEAQGLGADHFHPVAVSTAGEFLEDWELKFLRGWMDRLSKGQRG